MVHYDTEFYKTISTEESTLKIIICQTTGQIISHSNQELYPSTPHKHILVKAISLDGSSSGPFIPPPFIKMFDRKNPIDHIPLTSVKQTLPTLSPVHCYTVCNGNCKNHPLMTPVVCKMMYGYAGWGDILYDEEQKQNNENKQKI